MTSGTLTKWFPKFRRILSGPATPSLSWGCSLEQAERLRALKAHPAWHHLEDLLKQVAQYEYDQLGKGLEYEQYLTQVGAYQAARRAVDLVDSLIQQADNINGRRAESEQHERDHSRSIFFGSALWD